MSYSSPYTVYFFQIPTFFTMTGIIIEPSFLLRAIQVSLLANIKTRNHRRLSLFSNLPHAISVILVKLLKCILNIVNFNSCMASSSQPCLSKNFYRLLTGSYHPLLFYNPISEKQNHLLKR